VVAGRSKACLLRSDAGRHLPLLPGSLCRERHPRRPPKGKADARLRLDPSLVTGGDAFAFDENDDGDHAVWVANADGSNARQVPPGNDSSYPAWSQDGAKIAYLRGGWINVMNADGSASKRVIRADLEGTAPVWAPAKQITFYLGHDIWVVNPDGSGRRMAVQAEGEEAGFEIAPDGRTIAFSYLAAVANFELALGQVSGGEVRRLTDNDHQDDLQPSWAPDGKSLVFSRYERPANPDPESGPGDIYVINADGSGERNLTDSAADESSPAWSPER
jgi:Tol biopolymer transport system component